MFLLTLIMMQQLFCDHLSVYILIFGQLVSNQLCCKLFFIRIWVRILKTEAVEMFASSEISSHHLAVFFQKVVDNNHTCFIHCH